MGFVLPGPVGEKIVWYENFVERWHETECFTTAEESCLSFLTFNGSDSQIAKANHDDQILITQVYNL